MTKKIISISAILVLALFVGLAGIAKAAGNDIVFSAATTIGIQDVVVSSGSQVEGIVVDTSTVTVSMASGSTITFVSPSGKEMTLSPAAAGIVDYSTIGTTTTTITYNSDYPEVVLTVASTLYSKLTEVNVYANPLTAGSASEYTITFKTSTVLSAGDDKIQLDFGTEFIIVDTGTVEVKDDATTITSSFTTAGTIVTITLTTAVVASSIIEITLTDVVTNPSTATADTAESGIDIYTTNNAGTKIDVVLNQTAFNRVITLVNGWNIFAPSQTLESSAVATVITANAGLTSDHYDALFTLVWDGSIMDWQTATTIDPLYGYAIHIISGTTHELPLDFAEEKPSNSTFSRDLDNKGWYLIGYTGTTASLDAQTNCLGGLTTGGYEEFSSIVDLTGTTSGSVPTSHLISDSSTSEIATDSGMLFAKDYGYAVFTTLINLTLEGSRDR